MVQREDGGANLSGKNMEAVPELWTEQRILSRLQRIPTVTGRRYQSFLVSAECKEFLEFRW